jgi:PAS domain-containing protein
MKSFVNKLLAPHHLEYLAVDGDFNILETSANVQRFADSGSIITAGNDVFSCFPELYGTEDILTDILSGVLPNFEFKAITRVLENNSLVYFDLYIVQYEEENFNSLIIFLEDVTDRMALEQTLVQATNEMNILISALAGAKNYIDKIITSMAEALLVTTPAGKIKKINPAAEQLFGYSESELLGNSI